MRAFYFATFPQDENNNTYITLPAFPGGQLTDTPIDRQDNRSIAEIPSRLPKYNVGGGEVSKRVR